MSESEQRPNPDRLLKSIESEQTANSGKKGKLKIFLGYAAGVGKTYAMLDDARGLYRSGVDVVVGYVQPHNRPDTQNLAKDLPNIPPMKVQYKGITLSEFDLESALTRRPEIILVDELAHTNIGGVRNKKRYQDIEELLAAGIDVYTTVNVQHIESLNDIVESITKIPIRETVPDYIFEKAELVKLIDIAPEELLKRFEQGKIYRPDRVSVAMRNFFTDENLRLLRELALRKITERISHDNQNEYSITDKTVNRRFLVCIGPSPSSAKCIRWTARTAEAFQAPWTVLFVETPETADFSEQQTRQLHDNMDLASRLGAQIVTLTGFKIAETVAGYAKISGITNIVIGKSRKQNVIKRLFEPDLEDELISRLSNIEVYIIPDRDNITPYKPKKQLRLRTNLYFSWADSTKTVLFIIAATLISLLLKAVGFGDQNTIVVYILFLLIISRFTAGYIYGIAASVLCVLLYDFLFIEPYFDLTVFQAGYPVTFIVMLSVALITSAMMMRIKTQARLAVSREHRTQMLYELNKKLLSTRGLQNIVSLTEDYISAIYDRSVIFYTTDPIDGSFGAVKLSSSDNDASFLHNEDEQAVAHWVFVNRKRAGAGTDTLMGAAVYYMPILSQGNVLGVIGISCKTSDTLNHDNRAFLRMIASLVALALERQRLSDEQRKKDISKSARSKSE